MLTHRTSGFVFLLAAGCSAPEDEQPVELKPGLYRVVMNGTIHEGDEAAHRETDKRELCIGPAESREFPSDPFSIAMPSAAVCSPLPAERVGNRLSGDYRCDEIAGGVMLDWRVHYSGRVHGTGFEFKGTMTGGPAGSNQEVVDRRARFTVKGERLGDCARTAG